MANWSTRNTSPDPPIPDRSVEIYSMTKSYLSALIGIAMDQGLLDSLDHKVIEYFPEYFYPVTNPRMKDVTLPRPVDHVG